jgi:hypothetical protein
MSVRRFLDASSGHLCPGTWHWLDEQTADDAVRDPANPGAEILGGRTRHGWFIYACEDPITPIPADLANMMQYARRQGCEYVLLDCDTLPMEDLPVLHPEFVDK